jgi:hypothetical protein
MRAWEVLAQASATTTSTTSTTTTTLVQAVGGQGGSSRSDVWIPLLAALLGALVGGLLALVGSVLVKRWELKKTTRIRMYDELIPSLYRHYSGSSIVIGLVDLGIRKGPVPRPTMKFIDYVGELHRAGIVAGPSEAQIAEQIWTLVGEHTAYDMQLNLAWHPNRDLMAMDRELQRLVTELNSHLERKLTSSYRRPSPKRGDGHG